MRPDGKTQYLSREPLGDRKGGGSHSKVAISMLKMRGDRIMYQGFDAPIAQISCKFVTPVSADNEQVPDGLGPIGHMGRDDRGSRKEIQITFGEIAPMGVPPVEMPKLDPKHRRLERVEPRIDPTDLIHIFLSGSVIAERPHTLRYSRIVGSDGARIAERSEILSGVKAPGDGVAVTSDALPFVSRAMSLRGILDQPQSMPTRNLQQGIQVGRLTVKMCWKDDLGSRRDGGFGPLGIEIMGAGIRLDRNRRPPCQGHREPGGDIAVARYDHFVPRTHIQGSKDQVQSIEAVSNSDTMVASDIFLEFGLERFNLRPEDEPAGIDHAPDCGVHLAANVPVKGSQIEEPNAHAACPRVASATKLS